MVLVDTALEGAVLIAVLTVVGLRVRATFLPRVPVLAIALSGRAVGLDGRCLPASEGEQGDDDDRGDGSLDALTTAH